MLNAPSSVMLLLLSTVLYFFLYNDNKVNLLTCTQEVYTQAWKRM